MPARCGSNCGPSSLPIRDRHLKGLLEAVLDDEEIARRYRIAPAAKQIHHAFLGGLLEHVLSVCGLAKSAAAHYPNIDYDLLVTGAILHDIGKIYELNYERGFSYSNEGQLIGHISIAMRMMGDKLRGLPDFPPLLRSLVEHMILSHHGKLEFGSPKVPQFPEALLLHYLDDLDSKMEAMRAQIENDRQVEGCFTSYNPALDRAALKKDRYLNPAAPPEPARGKPSGRFEVRGASSPAARPRPARPPWQATLSWQRNSCRPGSSVPRQTDAQDRARCASTSGTGLSPGALDAAGRQCQGRTGSRGPLPPLGLHHHHDRVGPPGSQGQTDPAQGGPGLRLFTPGLPRLHASRRPARTGRRLLRWLRSRVARIPPSHRRNRSEALRLPHEEHQIDTVLL